MAQEILVRETLTKEMIEAGVKLITRLDQAGLDVTSCFWWYMSESNTWRLLIASPEVKTAGPKKVYEKIQAVLSETPTNERIALKDISVLSNDDPLISALRKDFRTDREISGVSVVASPLGGYYVDDAFIYRST